MRRGQLTDLPGLRDIILKACAREPDDRFPSTDDMLAQLNEARSRLSKAPSSAGRWSSILRLLGRKQKG